MQVLRLKGEEMSEIRLLLSISHVRQFGQAVGLDDSCKSLPTEIILFYSPDGTAFSYRVTDLLPIPAPVVPTRCSG